VKSDHIVITNNYLLSEGCLKDNSGITWIQLDPLGVDVLNFSLKLKPILENMEFCSLLEYF